MMAKVARWRERHRFALRASGYRYWRTDLLIHLIELALLSPSRVPVIFNFLVGYDLHMTVVDRVKIALVGGQKGDSEKPKGLSEYSVESS